MIPLTAADLARKQGSSTLPSAPSALPPASAPPFSTTFAGWIADRYGLRIAFLALSAAGGAALLAVLLAMPETRPQSVTEPRSQANGESMQPNTPL
jgi:MFS family permease